MDRRHGLMPRRPPAHKSVSLRHSPAIQLPSAPSAPSATSTSLEPQPSTVTSTDDGRPASVSPPRVEKNQSSGESSDAGKWFENTNNNTQPMTSQPVDNDPPFFLRNNSSASSSPPDGPEAHMPQPGPSMPYRPGVRRLPTDGGSTEDFRGVIDDLTIVNKKLKQKLKRYEKLHDARHQDEKLFEVRFHGRLPDHKKKELEETLRKFAQDLEDDQATGAHSPVPLATQHATSNLTYPTESGYVSMSASGQNSNSAAPSGQDSEIRNVSKSQYNDRQQSIQSYLHDIPVGLLPKHNAPMSDKSKKKLVVRRLEQVFAGKRPTPGLHPQPMQQEEVAQSAATADRKVREAAGQRTREGLREALIMPMQKEDGTTGSRSTHAAAQALFPDLIGQEQTGNGSGSPDQRPTRPLDLDPYRAQVPAENMDYIRHLGFSLPGDTTSDEMSQDGQGWIYLNLLINMAQLHTINVTPDFVKDALTEYSSKFELSHDGRKVRWRGGNELTLNSDSSSEQLSGNSNSPDDLAASASRSPSKRVKTERGGSSTDAAEEERRARIAARAAKEKDRNKLAYTPIFFQRQESDESDDIYNGMTSSGDSPFHPQPQGDSSGFASSGLRSNSSRKRRDEGPMIFYTKANFCTDLSGDRSAMSDKPGSEYKSVTSQPLGVSTRASHGVTPRTGIIEPRGPMEHALELDPKDGDGLGSSSDDNHHEFGLTDLRHDLSDSSPSTMEFEASGIGGVQPEDNFAIRVRRSQSRGTPERGSGLKSHKPRLYPKKILDALDEEDSQAASASSKPVINEQIISTSSKMLPSSALPPASFLPFDSTSSGDVDSDLESDVSSTPSESEESRRPAKSGTPEFAAHPHHYVPPRKPHAAARRDSDDDSDSSTDLLAIPPPVDLSTMKPPDRDDFDPELADRLAAEIPAGSSAATAGGGSGFNSPIDMPTSEGGDSRSSGRKAQHQQPRSCSSPTSAGARANLKRARTSDSMKAALAEPSKTRRMS